MTCSVLSVFSCPSSPSPSPCRRYLAADSLWSRAEPGRWSGSPCARMTRGDQLETGVLVGACCVLLPASGMRHTTRSGSGGRPRVLSVQVVGTWGLRPKQSINQHYTINIVDAIRFHSSRKGQEVSVSNCDHECARRHPLGGTGRAGRCASELA